MKEPTLVINHSAVPSVTKMVSLMMARDTKEPRAVINHSVAPNVTTNVYYQTTKRHERTRTCNFDLVDEVSGVKASGWFAKLWTVRPVRHNKHAFSD